MRIGHPKHWQLQCCRNVVMPLQPLKKNPNLQTKALQMAHEPLNNCLLGHVQPHPYNKSLSILDLQAQVKILYNNDSLINLQQVLFQILCQTLPMNFTNRFVFLKLVTNPR
jgi:hypothetical protein